MKKQFYYLYYVFFLLIFNYSDAQQQITINPLNNNWWTGYVSKDGTNYIDIDGPIRAGHNYLTGENYRGYTDFYINDIPDCAAISDIELYIYTSTDSWTSLELSIKHLTIDPLSIRGEILYNAIGSGYTYASGWNAMQTTGWHSINLNNLAIDDLQSLLSTSSKWVLGIEGSSDDWGEADGWNSTHKPYCIITYSLPNLYVTPTIRNVNNSSGTTYFDVSNTGGGTMQWYASVIGSSWLTITNGSSGTNDGTIECSFSANPNNFQRSGTIRITTACGSGSPKDVTVIQQAGQPILSVVPDNRNVDFSEGTTDFDVTNSGTGTLYWNAVVTSGNEWLTITSGSSGVNAGTISCSYLLNPNITQRVGTILVAGEYTSSEYVTVTQEPSPPFTQQTSILLTGVSSSSLGWGDYDNDDDLDIILTGTTGSERIAEIYKNENGSFTQQESISLTGVSDGSVDWGDYDNDGYLDILLTGTTGSDYISKIYHNEGGTSFTELTSVSLIGVAYSSAKWGDYDNDGDLDILITGLHYSFPVSTPVSRIYRNDGATFTAQTQISLTGVAYSSAGWIDYDNDGDLDIFLTGDAGGSMNYASKIFRNNGDNTFTEQTSISFTPAYNSSADWGDYDNDGYLDLLLTGFAGPDKMSKIYRNNGNNTFTEQSSILLTALDNGTAVWGDYDNDGSLDILLTGDSGNDYVAIIYHNNNDNSFTEQSFSLSGVAYGDAAWGDNDNDGDLDVLLTGNTWDNEKVTKLYRNNNTFTNSLPSVPYNLASEINERDVKLRWNKSSDNETPANGLNYNIVIGTSPNNINIVSPMSDRNNGYRRIVGIGNTNKDTSWTIKGLPDGDYYWSVQAIDNTFAGSNFASEGNFSVTGVDLFFQKFYQATGLPDPIIIYPDNRNTKNFNAHSIDIPVTGTGNKSSQYSSERTGKLSIKRICVPKLINNIILKGVINNIGISPSAYTLNYTVGGISQSPYIGPVINPGNTDTASISFSPFERGTFLVDGTIDVLNDLDSSNNNNKFRMRVYSDVYSRTCYDAGDNQPYLFAGLTDSARIIAGVRFTADSTISLGGVDFLCRTESVDTSKWTVQIREAGTSTQEPGSVLYTKDYDSPAYFESSELGAWLHFAFEDSVPVFDAGSDYWITVQAPQGIRRPCGLQASGIAPDRSFWKHPDFSGWNQLIIGPTSYAWVMRSVNIEATTAFQLSIDIADGWNMVSVPGNNPDGMDVGNWWADLTGTVYKFVPGSGYSGITTTTPGEGYWLKNNGTETYNYPSIQIVAHDPIGATGGWNMFGGYEDTINVMAVTTLPPDQIIYPIYSFLPGTGYQTASTIVPGYGYWVKFLGDCQIIIPYEASKGLAKEVEYFKDYLPDGKAGWGKIIITDAAGSSYTLLAVKGHSPDGGAGVDLNKYELPPLPPAGAFDARYSSGRIAEDINGSAQGIDLRGVVYPIKVKVEGMEIRLQDVAGNLIDTNLKDSDEIIISNSKIDKLMVSGQLLPDKFALEQNFPNPFNPTTTIKFSIPKEVQVNLDIYDVLGAKVKELKNEVMKPGYYEVNLDASALASGVYFYRIKAGDLVATKKMILLR